MGTDPAGARILRAKYLDWCSARLDDRFLRLTPEEIFDLAQEASVADAAEARSSWDSTPESYRTMVERVTEVLALRLELPPYEQWAAAYEAHPEQFDHELLGLWKEGVPA
jgi:hypothetical protein